jgi:pyruvate carboxylase
VKVTPSSKVVGDMALFMVTNELTSADVLDPARPLNFPRSVVEMMQGMIGRPDEGWPKEVQQRVLAAARAEPLHDRPGATLPPLDFDAAARELKRKTGREPGEEDVLSYALYPQVSLDYAAHFQRYGDTSVVPTANFFYGLLAGEEIAVEIERGKTLIIRYLTTGDVRDDGTRTVFFELNGQPREVNVADRSAAQLVERHPKADPDNADHVAAPMPGKIWTVVVHKGQPVRAGERLLSIEAMKMETAVYSSRDSKIADVFVKAGSAVEAQDLLLVLEG